MKFQYSFTRKEIEAVAEIYGSIDEINELMDMPKLGLKDLIMTELGQTVTKDLPPYGRMVVTKDKIEMIIEIPEELVVEFLEIYADLITDVGGILVSTALAIKLLAKRYEKRFEKLENLGY